MYGGARTNIASVGSLQAYRLLLITKTDADSARGVHHVAVGVHQLDGTNRIRNIAAFHVRVHQADHAAEVPGGDEIYCGYTEAGAEDAVKWRWRAAALDMSEHGD